MKIVPNLPFSKEILYLSTKISDDIFPCLSAKISFVSHWLPIFYFPICFRKIDYIPLFHEKVSPYFLHFFLMFPQFMCFA